MDPNSRAFCWASCQGYMDPKRYTGWWFQSLWKILVNWDDDSQYMEKQKMFQTTNHAVCIKILGPGSLLSRRSMNGVDFASYISCITIFAIFESLNQYFACLYHHLDDWITRLHFLMVKSNLSWCHQRFHFVKSTLFLDKSPIFLGQTTIFGWVNSDLSTARAVFPNSSTCAKIAKACADTAPKAVCACPCERATDQRHGMGLGSGSMWVSWNDIISDIMLI